MASRFTKQKYACAWFFVAPALFYGTFTSRLPALKAMLGANDSHIGLILLALGCATVIGLLGATALVDRLGASRVLAPGTVIMAVAIVVACGAPGIPAMACCFAVCGLAVGFCDVAMNAQGIALERQSGQLCLSTLHAWSGIGGALGALAGSLCAGFQISPFLNSLLVALLFLPAMPLVLRHMPPDKRFSAQGKINLHALATVPWIVWFCGLTGLVCHVAEGSAGEWGSLLLHNAKGASQQMAGLVFVAFTSSLVICRLMADKLRQYVSDGHLVTLGGLLAAAGMALALLSPWPQLCLLGYALMGTGLAPIAPILFSRAGRAENITPGQASGIVSLFSYAGLLLLPPLLGILAQGIGLAAALWVIALLCVVLALAGTALGNSKQPHSH